MQSVKMLTSVLSTDSFEDFKESTEPEKRLLKWLL